MNINEMRNKLKEACESTDCEKCVLYGQICKFKGYFEEVSDHMTDKKILDAYQTYFFQKDKDPRTLGETIRFLKGIGAIPENDGKDDSSKPILSRVPPEIIRAIERVREYGCRKYPEDSWKDVEPQRYWEAALRHMLAAWKDYRAVDPESGLPHIWHIACNLAFIIAQEANDERNIIPCKADR